jgi:two-component system, chemotaxis family, CheB/CheR fusion protein
MPKKTGPARRSAREVKAANPSTPVIAGIGASAGGLDAFTRLLRNLPAKPGAAFVLVQHLDPTRESILPSLLSRATSMPVGEARDGMRIEADQVHVIPPGMDIAIADGHLRLVPRPERRSPHMPLDPFLSTLADVQGSRAIAVILSGTGSDGTLGCKAVKTAGGIAFAQDPATATYDGMPRSAIAGGCVDFVLPPEGIAREIARLAREPYVRALPGPSPLPPRSVNRGHSSGYLRS